MEQQNITQNITQNDTTGHSHHNLISGDVVSDTSNTNTNIESQNIFQRFWNWILSLFKS